MIKILFALVLTFNLLIHSDDYSDQRGMTKLLGSQTYQRCSNEMNKPGAKVYELSYKRTSTMPLSPFAGEYKPKFLPEIPWACLLYTSPSPRDGLLSRMPSSA